MTNKWGGMFDEKKQTKGQKFGEIFIVKKGKKINVRDMINEANVDLEIYETLEKYNMIKQTEQKDLSELINEVGELDLMKSLEKINKANEIWTNIPLETKQIFNNDVHNFIDNAEKYFKDLQAKKIEEEQKRKEEEKTKKEKETKINEQK